jgi:hypothetical protein
VEEQFECVVPLTAWESTPSRKKFTNCPCGKLATMNYSTELYGVKCVACKDNSMINVMRDNADLRYIQLIESLGGTVAERYQTNSIPIKCICKNGHVCYPFPSSVQQGQGICKICAGKDPLVAENRFRDQIKRLNGTIIGRYINITTRVKCICSHNHECYPTPHSINLGEGMCKICTGKDFETAKRNFYKSIIRLGGIVIGKYINSFTLVDCICKEGHNCNVYPNGIQQGRGMCPTCSGKNSVLPKQRFYESVIKMGGKTIGEYIGSGERVKCICKEGHVCCPRPSGIQQGYNICNTCTRKTERKFYDYFSTEFPGLIAQFKAEWCKNEKTKKHFPFDFCFPDVMLIVEIDGPQHYRQISNWRSHVEQNIRDKYKVKCALDNGYTVIRMCQEEIYYDIINWKGIMRKEIYFRESPQLLICSNNDNIHLSFKDTMPDSS